MNRKIGYLLFVVAGLSVLKENVLITTGLFTLTAIAFYGEKDARLWYGYSLIGVSSAYIFHVELHFAAVVGLITGIVLSGLSFLFNSKDAGILEEISDELGDTD